MDENIKIPDGWEVGSLLNLTKLNPAREKITDSNLKVSFIGMEDTSEETRLIRTKEKSYYEVKSGYTFFKESDILFAKITPCMENGKGCLAKNLKNKIGFGSTEFHVLRAIDNSDIEFIYQYSKDKKLRLKAEAMMTGSAGQRRVPSDFFRKYLIAIPLKSERVEIANILSKQDQVIQKEEEYLEKLKKLKAGLMDDLLTGRKRVKF